MYAVFPVLWCSNLQTGISLSTIEAECIALSQVMHEVIPFTFRYSLILLCTIARL